MVATTPSNNFIAVLGSLVHATLTEVELRLGMGSDKILYVFSKTQDMVHNGDVNGTLKDMNHFFKGLLQALPVQPDVFVKNSSLVGQRIGTLKRSDGFAGLTIVADSGTIR